MSERARANVKAPVTRREGYRAVSIMKGSWQAHDSTTLPPRRSARGIGDYGPGASSCSRRPTSAGRSSCGTRSHSSSTTLRDPGMAAAKRSAAATGTQRSWRPQTISVGPPATMGVDRQIALASPTLSSTPGTAASPWPSPSPRSPRSTTAWTTPAYCCSRGFPPSSSMASGGAGAPSFPSLRASLTSATAAAGPPSPGSALEKRRHSWFSPGRKASGGTA